MPDTTSAVLEEARALLGKRLGELDEERRQLERALLQLGGGAPARPDPAPPARPLRAKRQPPRRRRKGGRAAQAVRFVKKHPGLTGSEIANGMKTKPNYVYRLLGELETGGAVKKEGRKYFPAE